MPDAPGPYQPTELLRYLLKRSIWSIAVVKQLENGRLYQGAERQKRQLFVSFPAGPLPEVCVD